MRRSFGAGEIKKVTREGTSRHSLLPGAEKLFIWQTKNRRSSSPFCAADVTGKRQSAANLVSGILKHQRLAGKHGIHAGDDVIFNSALLTASCF